MRWGRIAVVVAVLSLGRTVTGMAAPEDAIIPIDQYTTAKAKALATAYQGQLLQFSDYVYHCLPWIGIVKNGIGFHQPLGVEADDRYLSVWISIDQNTDGPFGELPLNARVSAMFSRYGVDMLRRLTQIGGITSDADVRGFSVVLSWLKPASSGGGKTPLMESLALFIDKSSLTEFLAKRLSAPEFTSRAVFNVFEGKERIGRVPLDVWEDNFNSTFKIPNYVLAPGKKC